MNCYEFNEVKPICINSTIYSPSSEALQITFMKLNKFKCIFLSIVRKVHCPLELQICCCSAILPKQK